MIGCFLMQDVVCDGFFLTGGLHPDLPNIFCQKICVRQKILHAMTFLGRKICFLTSLLPAKEIKCGLHPESGTFNQCPFSDRIRRQAPLDHRVRVVTKERTHRAVLNSESTTYGTSSNGLKYTVLYRRLPERVLCSRLGLLYSPSWLFSTFFVQNHHISTTPLFGPHMSE